MEKKYFTIRINEDLQAQFKSKAALEKSNMAQVLERLITQYLAEKAKKVEDNNVRQEAKQ